MIEIPEGLPLTVSPLTVADLDELMAIERAVQAAPWPRAGYQQELEQNELAFYWAVKQTPAQSSTNSWFNALRHPHPLRGYAGYWLMVDEAHISIIAVDPAWQRRGIGELLLLVMLDDAIRRQALLMTLEVRQTNQAAQALYEKYQFQIVGRRKRYYRDSNEDAQIMTVAEIQGARYRTFLAERSEALFAHMQGALA
ncbi:MAG: ribosomal protein S18-alanine N-acetyltransferase [Anaerolineales bacterium]|nr:ribosomal protein S18-alanine N-acetyltransferase [Anaerolineales bacterium]MCB9127998.1 ribosomal protein S18-alanine N-acetyltransferase [Ardenticatenales bacterium]MCB9172014.1 ribosomal protein S18-alanine N-acetyltransferase [Ardenticatenales bacterium]